MSNNRCSDSSGLLCQQVLVFPSHLLSLPLFLSPADLVGTQIRGHKEGSSPASPLRFMPCTNIATRSQPFLSSSTRVELRLPTLGTLITQRYGATSFAKYTSDLRFFESPRLRSFVSHILCFNVFVLNSAATPMVARPILNVSVRHTLPHIII